MRDLPLTEWMKCSDIPVRDGWYDVERHLATSKPIERVKFSNGRWERESTVSGIAIWGFADFWRGVAVDPETLK